MSTLPIWLQAGLWGLLAGSALVIGAAIGYFTRISHRAIAAVMAFGSGVLISALSFDLVDERTSAADSSPPRSASWPAPHCLRRRTGCCRATGPPSASCPDTSSRPSRNSRAAAWPSRWAR